jgi:hypothetical protein
MISLFEMEERACGAPADLFLVGDGRMAPVDHKAQSLGLDVGPGC